MEEGTNAVLPDESSIGMRGMPELSMSIVGLNWESDACVVAGAVGARLGELGDSAKVAASESSSILSTPSKIGTWSIEDKEPMCGDTFVLLIGSNRVVAQMEGPTRKGEVPDVVFSPNTCPW
jgi:hypothetical protein